MHRVLTSPGFLIIVVLSAAFWHFRREAQPNGKNHYWILPRLAHKPTAARADAIIFN